MSWQPDDRIPEDDDRPDPRRTDLDLDAFRRELELLLVDASASDLDRRRAGPVLQQVAGAVSTVGWGRGLELLDVPRPTDVDGGLDGDDS